MTDRSTTVLIVAPRTRSAGYEYYDYVMPVGLAYISAVLKKNGYAVDSLNLNHSENPVEDVIRVASSNEEYNYVLTGGLSVHYTPVKKCVDAVRKYAPDAKIILGGGGISSRPELMINVLTPDYIVIGEGEETIVKLLQCLENNGNLSEVAGIGYCGPDKKIVITENRRPIRDINSIPFPDYEGMDFTKYIDQILPGTLYYYDVFDNPRPYPLIASRSCPYKCTFCYHPVGDKYRQRSIANIMDELDFALKRYKINLIDIYDELFAYKRERVFKFCKELKNLVKSVPWEVKWSCQMRVDAMDSEVVAAMKDAGCYILSLGLESYSETVLESMKKKITPQQIDTALRACRKLQMGVQGNFIFGDIAETTETARETLTYWKENRNLFGIGVAIGFIEVYPGTALYANCLERGIITDEIDFIENHLLEPRNITNTMTDQEFEQLKVDVDTIRTEGFIGVMPIKSKPQETHVKCPFCHGVSIYKNYPPPGWKTYHLKDICCRNCRMRFYVVSFTFKLYSLFLKIIGVRNRHYLNPIKKLLRR